MTCNNSKQYDLVIEQGTTFTKKITWTKNGEPVDLTPITLMGGIASDFESGTQLATFDFTPINITGGVFAFSIPASATALMEGNQTLNKSQRMTHYGVFSIDWDDSVQVGRLIEGKVTISRKP